MAEFDFIVIEGGSAGLTAAAFAVQFGAKTALIEKHRLGGDCTWTGCVPSKTFLKAAKVAHQMRTAERFGLVSVKPQVNLRDVMEHVRQTVQEIYQEESPEMLRADGINVFQGPAQFVGTHKIDVDGEKLTGRNILISTGAHPFVPSIAGLDLVNFDTYETIWNMERLPERMIVVGGGPIGCEMAQAFRRLGSQVTLVEGGERLLLQDDLQSSQVIAKVFSDEGVTLHLNASVKRVWQDQVGIHVDIEDGEIVGDALLVAVGRKPNVAGLGLENAGVQYSTVRMGLMLISIYALTRNIYLLREIAPAAINSPIMPAGKRRWLHAMCFCQVIRRAKQILFLGQRLPILKSRRSV